MEVPPEIADRFAARGASSSLVARIRQLGTDGPPLEKLNKTTGRGVKFIEDEANARISSLSAGPGPRSGQEFVPSQPSLSQGGEGGPRDSRGQNLKNRAMSKKGIDVEDLLMRAVTEDLELEDLRGLVEAEGLLGGDLKEEDAPELWYDQNRKPLDAVQLAVKADIEFVMALENERRKEKAQPISKASLHRLARPHAPKGTEERRELHQYHKGGADKWLEAKSTELKARKQEEERKMATTGRFLEDARARLPEYMEEKRRREEAERLAKEEEARRAEEDKKRANILTKQRVNEDLDEYLEKRKRQLEKGKEIRAKRTGMFSLHNGGVRTGMLGRTDYRGSMSITSTSLASTGAFR